MPPAPLHGGRRCGTHGLELPPPPSPCTHTNGPLCPLTPELKTLLMAACQEMSLPHRKDGGDSTVLPQSLPVLMGLGPPQRWVGNVSPRPRRAGTEAAQPTLSAGSMVPLPGGWDRREGPPLRGVEAEAVLCLGTNAKQTRPARAPSLPRGPEAPHTQRLPTPLRKIQVRELPRESQQDDGSPGPRPCGRGPGTARPARPCDPGADGEPG